MTDPLTDMCLKNLLLSSAALKRLLAAAAFILIYPAHARAQEGWGVVGSCALERAKGPNSKITSLAFLDDRRGVLVGDMGLVRVTRNGGVTWSKPQFEPPFSTGIADDVQRVVTSNDNALLVSYKFVLHSRNGGERWSALLTPTFLDYKDFGTGLSTYFYDASLVGDDAWVLGAVYDTVGKVFKGSFLLYYNLADQHPAPRITKLNPEEAGTEFFQIFFADRDAGWVVGTKGALLKSDDGGNNWHPPGVPLFEPPARPGGRTAEPASGEGQTPRPNKPKLNSVYFVDRNRGWVVGDNGTTFFSEDGGESWRPGNVMAGNPAVKKANLTQVQFIDESRGWAVGSAGTVVRTIDGGRTWTPEFLPKTVTQTLYAVQMVNESSGWVAGAGDMLLRYDALFPDNERRGGSKLRERPRDNH